MVGGPDLDLNVAMMTEMGNGVGDGKERKENDEGQSESKGVHFYKTTTIERRRDEGRRTRRPTTPQLYVQSAHPTDRARDTKFLGVVVDLERSAGALFPLL